jgi:hypothetical protein
VSRPTTHCSGRCLRAAAERAIVVRQPTMTFRSLAALILWGLAVLVAILQLGAIISAHRQRRGYSLVPFVGALLGVTGCLVAPWTHSAYGIPIFLVLDPTPVMFAFLAITGRLSK